MAKYDEYTMSTGAVLTVVCGYTGEEDFYFMHKLADELIAPDESGFSVDSMCVGGYIRKDGLLLRTSSESPYDDMSFFYDPTKMSEEEVTKVKGWIDQIVDTLHERRPK